MRPVLCALALAVSGPVAAAAHAQTGSLAGTVRDARTGEAFVGVNVHLKGTALGAATDVDGRFVVRDVPPGRYPVAVSYVGYTRLAFADVPIADGQHHRLNAALTVDPNATELCLCYADYPVADRSPVASRVLRRDDLLNLPIGR